MTEEALIFDIQRFSLHDGPGIRTLFFFKGCPLRCRWCQNPEGLTTSIEIAFYAQFCIGCGACAQVCPENAITFEGDQRIIRERCTRCGACAEVCYAEALRVVGKAYTPKELLEEALKDEPFYQTSGGGITVSGGDPTLQPKPLLAFLKLCKEKGLHTAMETCGYTSWETLAALLPYLDLVLYDLKAVDGDLHRALTGRDNGRILDNLRRIVAAGKTVIPRIPLVPTMNATEENLAQTADLAAELGLEQVHLMPYHRLGESKLPRIESELVPLNLADLTEEDKGRAASIFQARGIRVVMGGG